MADGNVSGVVVASRGFVLTCIGCGKTRSGAKRREAVRFKGYCKVCCARRAAEAAKQRHLADYEQRHGRASPRALDLPYFTRTFSPLHVVTCQTNGEQFLARIKVTTCHCDGCKRLRRAVGKSKQRAAYMRSEAKKRGPIRIEVAHCLQCGANIGEQLLGAGAGSGSRRRLCDECRAANERMARSARGSQSHTSRARRYGVERRSVNRLAVLSRDGWRCQSCGCDTPQALNGTYHDNAPEMDHIVPLSRGGGHTEQNTQCLCRVCNILKGSMTMDEWRLSAQLAAQGAKSPEFFS